jgi:hypothetical protein
MPKKLTILGVLTALAFGALNFFQGSASAEIQTFSPTGSEIVATATCYQGAEPVDIDPITCGAGSSLTSVTGTTGDPLTLYSVIRLDAGARLTLPITFTHNAFYGTDPAISTTTGEVTAATDLLCSGGSPDILAGPLSTPGAWPGAGWDGYPFSRIADSNDPLPPADAYVDIIRPQPASFPFASSDLATLTHLWLAGGALFPLPTPTKLNLAAYSSAYGTFRSSVALLGGEPANPPTDDYICLDSPQHSIGTTGTGAGLVIPPTGSYVRYTMFTSAADVLDGSVSRILDADCVGVNTAPACDLSDADGDLVPAAVEASQGSGAGTPDGDGDGSNDYNELFNFTNPTVADTDGDGSADLRDNGADEGSGTDIDDTAADDNCPADANGTQTNTDFDAFAAAGPLPADATQPDQDAEGDACDTDDDNDGLNDVAEGVMTIVAWSGNTDPGGAGDAADTTVCKGPGVGAAPSVVMSPTNRDSDGDGYIDGIECQMSARPDEDDTGVASCTTVPVDADGCARIERTATDPDADKLYHPTSAAGHGGVEAFYRTRSIALDSSTTTHDADGDTTDGAADPDADNDTLIDGIEGWSYGTSPSNEDTDHDACHDGKEAADMQGNRTVNAADLGEIAKGTTGGSYRTASGIAPALYWKINADQNRNFVVNAQDLGLASAHILVGGGSCNVPTIDPNPAPGNGAANAQRGLAILNQLAP